MFNYLERRKTLLVYVPLTIYWLILIIATSLPAPDLPSIGFNDKVNHFLAYFVLAVLLNLTFVFQRKFRFLFDKAAIATILLCMIYGAIDELHQIYIPGRFAEILDWVADSTGAICGVLLINFLIRSLKYQPKFV